MNLREALSVLSKSSPYAVATEAEVIDPFFDEIKKYLYIQTDIEIAFKNALENIKSDTIIFLCGSSGDGKSEILTRYSQKYAAKVRFHLDATHSFESKLTAIETLDGVFKNSESERTPLVVGINIGMLGNYEREGSNDFNSIKQAIKQFLDKKVQYEDRFIFLDFEAFQKFEISDGRIRSIFFKTLLDRITRDDQNNKFRELYYSALDNPQEQLIAANFELLRDRNLQQIIILLLFQARIGKDQFITARTILDFVYCILTGPRYLFDNIFAGGDNELLEVLSDFDPSVNRNQKIDYFLLQRSLKIKDDYFSEFQMEVKKKYHIEFSSIKKPQSLIRLFYFLKDSPLKSKFISSLDTEFRIKSLDRFKEIWGLHNNYTGEKRELKSLKKFYYEIVFSAINRYANRNTPHLTKDEFFIHRHSGHELAAEIELGINYEAIKNNGALNLSQFNMHLTVNDEKIDPVPVNINLLELMDLIVHGFRPNKNEKNSIVLLDDLIKKISEMANRSKTLYLYTGRKRIKIKENADKDIRVSGL